LPIAVNISLVVCTHNGAARLPETLRHLTQQTLRAGQSCEVLVIDNASTDDTAELARACWPADSAIPFRVVSEPIPGLSSARACGWREARGELIAFIDDDNWLPPEWAARAVDIMKAHPDAAACGGPADPVFESEPPRWFDRFAENFAVGKQATISGDVTEIRPVLWGAGLTIRKSYLDRLSAIGYGTVGSDRKGARLASGGDTELCLAMVRMGGRMWYDQKLLLRHHLPTARLRWSYLRRLYHGFGAASVVIDFYRFETFLRSNRLANAIRTFWLYRLLRTLFEVIGRPGSLVRWAVGKEGSHDVLWVDQQLGRISELARWRGRYARGFRQMSQIQWPRR
jgi:glycosyltransferase involved in cell wall biosynthesis